MLDRRRFLALSVGSGSLAAVAPGVSASAAVPLWRSATWTARVGTSLDLVDAAGRHIPVVVAGVRTNATQAGTSGESFTVTFTSGRDVSEGNYRLRGANLAGSRAFLSAGDPGTAQLVVNTVRPA